METLGAVAKCAPPVRDPTPSASGCGSRSAAGRSTCITSDHSPSPPDLKAGRFGNAWGGIASCQTTLTLLLSEGHHGAAGRSAARLTSTGAAERFGMPSKGRLEPGADADLALVDLTASTRWPPRTSSTATRSPPGSAAGCAPASRARCCAAPRPGRSRRLLPHGS